MSRLKFKIKEKQSGIVLSETSGNVDFASLAEQVDFVFLTTGKGMNYVDPTLETYIKKCAEFDIPVMGYYHHAYCHSNEGAEVEAKYVVELINKSGNQTERPLVTFAWMEDSDEYNRSNKIRVTREGLNQISRIFLKTVVARDMQGIIVMDHEYIGPKYNHNTVFLARKWEICETSERKWYKDTIIVEKPAIKLKAVENPVRKLTYNMPKSTTTAD